MIRLKGVFVSVLAALLCCCAGYAADGFYVMPYDVDPPIEVDGDLGDWANVPNAIAVKQEAQVTWGREMWTDADDLSGTVYLAWRGAGLYFAAEVTDDKVLQPYTGMDIYNGDHVNLWLDLLPGVAPERTSFGRGQFHLVVSPGSLDANGGAKATTMPEVFFYIPEAMPAKDCLVAARRTPTGYVVEAYVPFATLKMSQVKRDQDMNFEVAISDADNVPTKQETFMTSDTRKWVYRRTRMVPMVLGDGNGKAQPPTRSQKLFKQATAEPGKSFTYEFEAQAVPPGKEAYLFFRGRVQNTKVAGWVAGSMAVELNGKRIEGKRITNRPMRSTMMRGDNDQYIYDDGRFVLWYAPDFKAVESHAQYKLIGGVKACEFEFNVEGLLKRGKNTLVFKNLAAVMPNTSRIAHLGDAELRIKPRMAAAQFKPAPTGEIPAWEPKLEFPKLYAELKQSRSRISFKVDDERFAVQSEFSAPDGKWHKGSSPFYEHKREVIEHAEWLEVRDTFRNLTQEKVPVMQRHVCNLGDRHQGLWLGGVEIPSRNGRKSNAGNPSVYATTKAHGIGLVALNDAFKVHLSAGASGGEIEMADRNFVLNPGATYTAEMAVIPTGSADFWEFINAARRMLEVNFRLELMFASMAGVDPVYQWSDKTFKNFAVNKSANFVIQSIYGPGKSRYKGRNPYSTSFLKVSHDYYYKFHERLRQAFPDKSVKHAIYYHCFIDNYDGNDVRFKADRKLDAAGNHMNYGGRFTYDKLYIPTLTNEFGKETAKVIDVILNDIKADGIFWDEFCTSRGEYVYNMWDGCSADIDMRTFKLGRLKGHSALLSRDWRAKQVKRIMAHGPLMCSGAPYTRALAALKYHSFCETGSVTNCRGMLLWTPIGLGDHLTERTQEDTYRQMLRQLDHGCLYAWYSTQVVATHKTLTEYMYPFTPMELRSGVLIGEERILTNRSGYFGWSDDSDFVAHVYDRDGKEVKDFKVPQVTRNGKKYAELRIAEGWSAALVRKK